MSGNGWRDAWWIPDESPGGIGDPELWVDAQALDYQGRGRPPIMTVMAANGGGSWVGMQLKFGNYPGADTAVVYTVVGRRHSRANHGQPYYVARIPDQPEVPDDDHRD